MRLVKQLLREKLTERYLEENFFKKMDEPLDDVIECVKNLFINIRFSVLEPTSISYGEKHKLAFFKSRLISALNDLKNTDKFNKDIPDKVSELESEFDYSLLKALKINKLLMKLAKTKDKGKLIDDYADELNSNIDNVFEKYKENLKKNKSYNSSKKLADDSKISYKKFIKKKYFLQIELLKLQEWVVANNKKLLIIFEGRDAAGKGSNIETFSEFLNPKHFRIETFGIPTPEEKKDWFKRYTKVLPKEGEIVFFDRSWYNRAVIEPAMGYCTEKQYKEFMNTVGDYESNLINKKDIILIKIWLDIDKTKQQLRFELRKRDPLNYWKYSENDSKMLSKWNKLTPYIDKMLDETSTTESPWEIISTDDKLSGILDAMKRVLNIISYEDKDVSVVHGKPDNIIFLDLHGVIITKWNKLPNGELDCTSGWDKECIKHLNTITDKADAKLVIISDCKKEVKWNELVELFKEIGVTGKLIGKTIDIDKHLRIEQIDNYMKNHNVKKFIVLDDKAFDYKTEPDVSKAWIQPEHHVGLTEKEVKLALQIFKEE